MTSFFSKVSIEELDRIRLVGIDLAKNVFHIHAVDERGKMIFKRKLRRNQVQAFFGKLPSCKVAMEACAGSHHWARQIQQSGHRTFIIPAQYVKPFVKTQKNDFLDAAAICEAAQRPDMRFVTTKSEAQQALLADHTYREMLVKQRTQKINSIRGHCLEFGLVAPKGRGMMEKMMVDLMVERDHTSLPQMALIVLGDMFNDYLNICYRIEKVEERIMAFFMQNELCQLLSTIPGIGFLTATALVATIGDASAFRNGRHLSAFLGLVPKQHSTGGKQTLGGITKHGNNYLRKLLIHGGRVMLSMYHRNKDSVHHKHRRLIENKNSKVAIVAIANFHARIVWSVLTRRQPYQAGYVSIRPNPQLAVDNA